MRRRRDCDCGSGRLLSSLAALAPFVLCNCDASHSSLLRCAHVATRHVTRWMHGATSRQRRPLRSELRTATSPSSEPLCSTQQPTHACQLVSTSICIPLAVCSALLCCCCCFVPPVCSDSASQQAALLLSVSRCSLSPPHRSMARHAACSRCSEQARVTTAGRVA